MILRNPVFHLLAALSICASSDTLAAERAAPRIYKVGEITLDRYTVIERIWVGSWRSFSIFDVPKRADEEGAVAALRAEAARVGADGIVNLHCLNDPGGFPGTAGYFCYANAITLK
jgi:hypothetical protein